MLAGSPVRAGSRLLEKVSVCPRPLEYDDIGFAFVDEEPVRLDVALTPPGEFTFQCVVPESWIKRHFLYGKPEFLSQSAQWSGMPASGAHLLEKVFETRVIMQVFAPVGLLERLAGHGVRNLHGEGESLAKPDL